MNLHLSAAAWAALGCLAGIALLSGAVLWAAWRRGLRSQGRSSPAEKISLPDLSQPWEREDAQYAELARAADELRAQRHDPSTENKPEK